MQLTKNQKCPVCGKAFREDDDVVFCPDCGTPHHRACYQQLTHCANEARHAEGFNFYEETKEKPSEDIVAEAKALLADRNAAAEAADASPEAAPRQGFSPFAIPLSQNPYERDTDTIDGESVADVAATVRTNVPRFIGKFKKQEKTGKRLGWNWGAFFFGAYYFFYRKMYRQGIFLFVLDFVLGYAEGFALTRLAPLTAAAFEQYATALSQGDRGIGDMTAMVTEMAALSDYKTFMLIRLAYIAVTVLLSVAFAACADYLYKKSAVERVKKIKQQLDEDTLSVSVEKDGVPLAGEQLKRMVLAQRGGTAYLPPLLAMLAWYFISMML
ncbi:MAG: DUF2628 domain-containing protein [Eubacterium sp.]|nr:DUF2628 domain-containing protein [Eubacterium sp.]